MTETKPERFDECLDSVGRWDGNCLTPDDVNDIYFLYKREGYNYYLASFLNNKYIYRTKIKTFQNCDKCNGSGKQ